MQTTLPSTGFVRLPQILQHIPISRSAWWAGCRSGRYPAGIRLSKNVTAWKAEDIHALIARLGASSNFTPERNPC